MTEQKWIRRSLDQLKKELAENGFSLSSPTISRLLKKNNFSLRVNMKNKGSKKNDPDRNRQFEYIKAEKIKYQEKGFPVISVDSKKKNLLEILKMQDDAGVKRLMKFMYMIFPVIR